MQFDKQTHNIEMHSLFLQPNKQNEQTSSLSRSDQIELEPNASKFAIFSAVRSSVLESETKLSRIYGATPDVTGKPSAATCCCHCATTCKSGATVECRCHHGQTKSQDNNDSENDVSCNLITVESFKIIFFWILSFRVLPMIPPKRSKLSCKYHRFVVNIEITLWLMVYG